MLSRSEIIHFENVSDAIKGILGTLATTGGLLMSYLTELELILRIISLLVGIAVGIVTIRSIRKRKS